MMMEAGTTHRMVHDLAHQGHHIHFAQIERHRALFHASGHEHAIGEGAQAIEVPHPALDQCLALIRSQIGP